MSKTSWQVKQRYNNKMYKRVNADLPKDLVDAFKTKCKEKGDSQAQIIKVAIEEYLKGE